MDGEGHIDEIRVLIIYVRTDEVLRIFLLCHPFFDGLYSIYQSNSHRYPTTVGSCICSILTVFAVIFMFFGLSGFALFPQDWQSP